MPLRTILPSPPRPYTTDPVPATATSAGWSVRVSRISQSLKIQIRPPANPISSNMDLHASASSSVSTPLTAAHRPLQSSGRS